MEAIESIVKEANMLKGAEVVAYNAKIDKDTYDASCFCQTCDCVCNQPCHGEGPCYSL